ncbi:RNA polymerase sigma factor [Pseudomonas sp. NUPR-001]|uniref:RNA polymerase sigma factor n=1 Tax=Pseudomonas sp. NUPR-001 TaxID=3416058 RepID=UPI003A9ED89C
MHRRKPDPLAHDTCRGFYADILHFLRKRMDNASDAADMTQDVFTQWLGYRDRARVEQPRAFLFQVARNLLSDHWRRQRVRHTLLDDQAAVDEHAVIDSNADPLNHAQQQQRLEQLKSVLGELSPRRREALMLHRFEGLTQAQIGERMGISVSMVEKHIAAALLHCKQRLDSDNGMEQPE